MAIYRLEAKFYGRERRGLSVLAAAAYGAGLKLKDWVRGKVFDWSCKSEGVIKSTILTPPEAPKWSHEIETLWNKVEASEQRSDAQTAKGFILAVPKELTHEQQFELAVTWAQKELVAKGMIAQVSLHHDKGSPNPHVHILCTLRKLDGDNFSKKKSREWNEKSVLQAQRVSWAEAQNAALEKAGRSERVDHRSLADRGLGQLPQPKLGVIATAMRRRGIPDSLRLREIRRVTLMNAVLPLVRTIQKYGEIRPLGMGRGWWQRSSFLVSRLKARASEAVVNTWTKLINSQRSKENQNDNEHSR